MKSKHKHFERGKYKKFKNSIPACAELPMPKMSPSKLFVFPPAKLI